MAEAARLPRRAVELLYCTACDIQLNSRNQYAVHCSGARHRKTIRLRGVMTFEEGTSAPPLGDGDADLAPATKRLRLDDTNTESCNAERTQSSVRVTDVEVAMSNLRAIVGALCPVLAVETLQRMWDRFRPSVQHLPELEGRLEWTQQLFRRPFCQPSEYVWGFSIAQVVEVARDDLACNPAANMTAEQTRALRFERLFLQVEKYFRNELSADEIYRAVRTIVDLEGGRLCPHFLAVGARHDIHFLLKQFVPSYCAMYRFQRAGLVDTMFHQRTRRTADDLHFGEDVAVVLVRNELDPPPPSFTEYFQLHRKFDIDDALDDDNSDSDDVYYDGDDHYDDDDGGDDDDEDISDGGF
jgi:hypothetical protein